MHLLLNKFLQKVLSKDTDGRFIAKKNDEDYRIELVEDKVIIENMITHEKEEKLQVLFFRELTTGLSFRRKQSKQKPKKKYLS